MKPASQMLDNQIDDELHTLGIKWDAFQADIGEGYGGSPGEWMVERMGELETEQRRRKKEKKMAKNLKRRPTHTEPEESTTEIEEEESAPENELPEPEKKELTKAEKKALFAAYEKTDAAWQAKKVEMEKLAVARSAAVKEIFELLGKGPFGYKGDTLIVVKRGDAYYFRGKSDRQIEEIG